MFRKLPASSLFLDFEQIEKHPIYTAIKIAHVICPVSGVIEANNLSMQILKEQDKTFSDALKQDPLKTRNIGNTFYDRETYFHRRHVSTLVHKHAFQRIGKKAVLIIRETYRNEVDSRGYFRRHVQPGC